MRVFIGARPALQQVAVKANSLTWAYVGQLAITIWAVAEHNSLRDVEAARGGGSYVLQKVRCGKSACRYARASGELHGPYRYLFTKKDGKTRSKYVGKNWVAEV